jgi:transposase
VIFAVRALERAASHEPEAEIRRASARAPGANIAALCREYGISRQTGHKWLRRYHEHAPLGLVEQSRRPRSSPLSQAEDIVAAIVELRDRRPSWGPDKIARVLTVRFGREALSRSTVARVLKRLGKVKRRRPLARLWTVDEREHVEVRAPNELWTIDSKGWWKAGNGQLCEPLTVRDAYSRYVLAAKLVGNKTRGTCAGREAVFCCAACAARMAGISPEKRRSISAQRDEFCISTRRRSLWIRPASRSTLKCCESVDLHSVAGADRGDDPARTAETTSEAATLAVATSSEVGCASCKGARTIRMPGKSASSGCHSASQATRTSTLSRRSGSPGAAAGLHSRYTRDSTSSGATAPLVLHRARVS